MFILLLSIPLDRMQYIWLYKPLPTKARGIKLNKFTRAWYSDNNILYTQTHREIHIRDIAQFTYLFCKTCANYASHRMYLYAVIEEPLPIKRDQDFV